ncbi:MAG TPA: hypothetical protein VNN73_22555, partial [Blastocatellia bacterium]|nr:hypothetical protein [Blastocatellia bacterium]
MIIEAKKIIGSAALMLAVMLMAATATVQAQTRDHDYDTDDNCYRYGRYAGYSMYRIAEENGYRDGVEHGREHRAERHSYDPKGTRHYKDAVEGYCDQWRDKDGYKRAYREAFLRGYDEGYRGGYYGNDPYYRDDPYYRGGDYGHGRNDDDYRYGRYGRSDIYRIAQQNGYRDGLRHGEEDRSRRRGYDYSHSD